MISFELLKRGSLGINGTTGQLHDRSLKGLVGLVDRALTEVRLGSLPPRRIPTRVSELMEEIELAASIEARSRNISLTVAAVEPGLMIEVDRQLLASAITNLLHNAFKFTRANGQVALTTNATHERVRIDVEDQCGGLPAGKADELFLPFEQRSEDRQGLGLGLTISRRAIQANGGTLSVQDHPGRGCTFTIDLPRGVPVSTAIPVVGSPPIE